MSTSDPASTPDLFERMVDHDIELAERVRLPDDVTASAILRVMAASSYVRRISGDPLLLAAVNETGTAGYFWARGRGVVSLDTDVTPYERLLKTRRLDIALADAAQIVVSKNQMISAEQTAREAVAEHVRGLGLRLTPEQEGAFSDAFLAGVAVRAAERHIVVAIDWLARQKRVRRQRRWDRLRWSRR